MTKFKVGDVVKLVNVDGLYSSQNYGDDVRLELGETYPVVEVGGSLIVLMKSDGTTEGCLPYRVELVTRKQLVTREQTAESLKNNILSIRQEREQALSRLKALNTQEAEAILQLNALGFSLFEEGKTGSSPSKTVLYAEDIEEDMTNSENWENGDILEVITYTDDMIPFGALVKHADVDGCESPYTSSEYHDCWAISDCYLKFHSRPVK